MNNLLATLATATTLLLASSPARATLEVDADQTIPTMLVATTQPTGYPDPICSKCSIIVVEDEASSGSRADIHIVYPEDAPSFEGRLRVTVQLPGGEQQELWLSDLSLEPGDEIELVAEAKTAWSWTVVDFVWLRFEADPQGL